MIEMIKCNFSCFLNVRVWRTASDIELGDVIFTSKTSPEFSVRLLAKDLFVFFEIDLHFINLLFSSDERKCMGEEEEGEEREHRLGGGRFNPICFRGYNCK